MRREGDYVGGWRPDRYRHTDHLQFDVEPEKPDPVYARKLQELIGGAFGEMTVTMPRSTEMGTQAGLIGKIKDTLDPNKP